MATERLILHIGQRVRWARGMIQIFRLDNPLFGPGLTIGQRICYLQAMGHFFFALPRVVFLTAPLAFLLFGLNIIAASPLAIVSYALPHIFHSVATNSRLQRNNRHSFWSEVYETVLALFLVRVTLVTLFAPRRGKFNVTNKGGLLENGYFDLGAVYPNLILAFFLVAGVIRGLFGILFLQTEQLTFQALMLNTIWGFFSLLTVMAALAVGRETRQIRSRARVRATVPVSIYLPDGRAVSGITQDLSQGGSSVVADRPLGVTDGSLVQFEFIIGGRAGGGARASAAVGPAVHAGELPARQRGGPKRRSCRWCSAAPMPGPTGARTRWIGRWPACSACWSASVACSVRRIGRRGRPDRQRPGGPRPPSDDRHRSRGRLDAGSGCRSSADGGAERAEQRLRRPSASRCHAGVVRLRPTAPARVAGYACRRRTGAAASVRSGLCRPAQRQRLTAVAERRERPPHADAGQRRVVRPCTRRWYGADAASSC